MTVPTTRQHDVYAAALDAPAEPLFLGTNDGFRIALPTEQWCGNANAADITVLDRCSGPTIDVGCGPGRIAGALALRGVPVLGIDIHPRAVGATAARGAAVLRRSVFDRLPGEGRWQHITLLDGNIGIGGDPGRLLRRCRDLIQRDGSVLVEVNEVEVDSRHTAWFEGTYGRSAPFSWALAGLAATTAAAEQAGLEIRDRWLAGGRRFVEMT